MSGKYLGGYLGAKPNWSRDRQSGVWRLTDRVIQVETAVKTVSVGAGDTVLDEIALIDPCIVLSVRPSKASWVVFYDSTAKALNDAGRLVTEDPLSANGVLLEIRVSGQQTIQTSPVPNFINRQPVPTGIFPMRVTNESASADVEVTVTYYPLIRFE
jgi:hypothetical protein